MRTALPTCLSTGALLAHGMVLLLLLASPGCHKHGAPALALEECDPAGYIGCIQQSSFLSVPVTDTNLFLTYSSRWASRGQSFWDAKALGLGGWSINVVQRYDRQNRLLISGDGTWRMTDAIQLPSGELAVPSYDGAVAFIFDSAGRHLRTVDGHLGLELVTVSYDTAGRLLQVDGNVNGQPVHVTVKRDLGGSPYLLGIEGAKTSLALDPNARLVAVTNPAGDITKVAWNPAGLVESETDPAGGSSKFTYDASGQLGSAADADGVMQTYESNSSPENLEIRVTSALGRRWTYRAKSSGSEIQRTVILPDGTVTTQTTDSRGNRLLKLADGTTWSVGLSPSPVWGSAAPLLTPITDTRPDGVSSRREWKYDLRPQRGLPYVLASSVTAIINGQPWTQHFDPDQRVIDLSDPAGRPTVLRYDTKGRLLNYSAPDAAPVSYTYNREGRLETKTLGSGKLARTTRYTYNADTGEIVTTRPDGVVEKAMVDRAGRIVAGSAGDGSTVVLGYDSDGRMNQLQPAGGLNFSLGMSAAGRVTAFVPPSAGGDASIEMSSYDKDGELSSTSGLGDRTISYGYDSAGRVTSVDFDQGKRTFTYDPHNGMLTRASDPAGVNTSYTYLGGVQTGVTWSGPVSGSVSVSLDANGRPVRESVNRSNYIDVTYDPSGNVIGIGPLNLVCDPTTGLVTRTRTGVVETTREYDQNKQIIRVQASAAGKPLLDVRYTRDSLERVQEVTEISELKRRSITEYIYDRADRLAEVRVNGRISERDDYDLAGNRINLVRAGKILNASVDDRDRLLAFADSHYTWMPDGSLTGIAQGQHAFAFVYDDFGALRQVSLPDGRKMTYLVDADGRRIGREVDGKLVAGYLYGPNGTVAAETDATGRIVSRFGYDELGHLAIVQRGGSTYRVITDQVGSPRLVIDSQTGAIVERVAYDAWGNVMQDIAPGFIPIGFAGGLRDADTGLIRFGARDYDPKTGRWTASDPIRFNGGDANLYRYAADDPVNRSDSTGLADSECTPQGVCVIPPPDWYLKGQPPPGSGNGNGTGPQGGNPSPNSNNGASGCTPEGVCNVSPPDWYLNGQLPPGPGNGNGTGPQGGNPSPNGNNGVPGCTPEGVCNVPPPDWYLNGQPPPTAPGNGSGNGRGPQGGNPPGGSPGFACTGIFCQGPNGSCWFCSMGEPHATAPNGFHFDFQAVGEFLVASSPDQKYIIQARQQPFLQGAAVTVNTALAANVSGDRVGVYAKEPSFLFLNNSPINALQVSKILPHGGFLQRQGGIVLIRWPGDGGVLSIKRVADSLNYSFEPGSNAALHFAGLLGNVSGAPDKIAARDGSLLSYSDVDFVHKLYKQLGNSWRIKQSESLFHYWPGESTAKFTDLDFPRSYVSAASLSPDRRRKAEFICRAVGVRGEPLLTDCIFDVAVTGQPAMAVASLGIRTAPASATAATYASTSPAAVAPSAPDQYTMSIGDTVSPDHPAKGAGTISKAGQQQTYAFAGKAGEHVYVKVGPCEGSPPIIEVRQPDEYPLANNGGCADFGPVTLPKTETYHIAATAVGPSAHYTFNLRPARFDQYSIKIGDTVSPDRPSNGAGIISDLGQRQAYVFDGKTGQTIYVGVGPCEGSQPSFDLLKPDHGLLASAIGNCNADLGRQTLPVSGSYQIVASTDKSSVYSRYSFYVRSTPPDQHFFVRLPLTVNPDVPMHGAGRITAAYEQQFYHFTAAAGTVIHIDGHCGGSCSERVGWPLQIRAAKVGDASNSAFSSMFLAKSFDWTLPEGGKYTIQVRSNGYVGDYSFTALGHH